MEVHRQLLVERNAGKELLGADVRYCERRGLVESTPETSPGQVLLV